MTQGEQKIYYEKALADAIGEYKHVSCLVDAIRMCVTDIDFEEKFPVSQERYLLVEKMKASEGVQTNLRNSIRFYRAMLEASKPEPWEENNATRTVETPCGTVRVVNTDKVSKEELDGIIHHCGQDTGECKVSCGNLEATVPCKNLLGMQVVRTDVPCDVCAMDTDNCVKVELVGGGYICLAKPQQEEQEDERPVISFDEEEQQQDETIRTIMDGIREQTQAFMEYLDSVVKG